MVRPILEYGNVVWSNGLKKHLTKIENVQRKFTKHVKGLHDLSYENRLKKLKLPSIEYRQARGDMIEVFKIVRNYYDYLSTKSIFKLKNNRRLRGHEYMICKHATNKSKYHKFFSNRIINIWNHLPHDVVNSKSINEFKNKFDLHQKDYHYCINFNYYKQ